MDITLLNVGKTDSKALDGLVSEYVNRLSKYIKFEVEYINVPKHAAKLQPNELKRLEGELILKKIKEGGFIVLLDEKGIEYSSKSFAVYLQKLMNSGYKHVYFITGGAYGFSDDVYNISNAKVSLSKLTTTHQLIRLFFTEQLYRAFTILNNHPYHND